MLSLSGTGVVSPAVNTGITVPADGFYQLSGYIETTSGGSADLERWLELSTPLGSVTSKAKGVSGKDADGLTVFLLATDVVNYRIAGQGSTLNTAAWAAKISLHNLGTDVA